MAGNKSTRRRVVRAKLANEHSQYFGALHQLYRELIGDAPRSEPWRWPENPQTDPNAVAFKAAMHAIEYRIACPPWVSDAVTAAWGRYRAFEVATIDEAFGIRPHRHHKARRKRIDRSAAHNVALEVEYQRANLEKARGRSLSAPTRRAIEVVAADHKKSIDWVKKKVAEANSDLRLLDEVESSNRLDDRLPRRRVKKPLE